MTPIPRFLFAALFALIAAVPLQSAQARAPYSQAELEQLLAPIALYPDALLSQVLLAATRPLEVVEAARWSRANPGLQGDDALGAVQQEDWDPSVKSLVAFPQLLARMDEQLEWTKALGDAFFVQEPVVMETVQELRRRARAAGNLMPDDRLRVYDDGQAILIEPAAPQVVYVPYYDPWIVYGPWRWSAYPPMAWAPWPGYTLARRPGVSTGLWWGPGIGISIGFMVGSVDWFHRRVRVPVHREYSRPVIMHRDPPLSRRAAPQAGILAPATETLPRPRAERPYARRDTRADIASPPQQRSEPRTAAIVESTPRLQQRTPEMRQPAPPRTERAARAETQRAERPPQTQPQAAQAPRPQPVPAAAQRAQAPHPHAARIEQGPRTAPQRGEPAPRHDRRDARERLQRGGARP